MRSLQSLLSRPDNLPLFSPKRVLVYIVAAGGLTELLVMSIFYFLPPLPLPAVILLDVSLSILVVFPVIFLGLMRPLRRLWDERQRAIDELELAHQRLEQRVQERTEALSQANESLLLEVMERKKVEKALLEKRSHLQFFLHQVPAILWLTDNQLNITYADGAGISMLGIDPEKMVGLTLNEFARVNSDHFVYAAHQKALQGESLVYEVKGKKRYYQVHLEPFLDPQGNITGSIGLAMDITEQKEAANRLHLQSTALDAAANGIMITDRQGIIQWANPALSQMTGFPLEEIIGKTPRFLNSGLQDQAFYDALWETILQGKVWQGELTNRRKDGSLYIEEQTITPVRSESGENLHFIAIKQDITKRVFAQREVQRRNQELARLNEFATAASSSLDEQVILDNIQHILAEEMQIPCGRIYRVHARDNLFHLDAQWGFLEEEAQVFMPLPLEAFPTQKVVQEQVVVIEPDTKQAPLFWMKNREGTREACRYQVWTPLVANGQIQGVLETYGNGSAIGVPEDSHFFHVLGGQIGIALQNAKLYKAEIRAREFAESLRQAGLAISQSLNLDTVFNTLLDFIELMVPYDYAFVALLESEDHFVMHASRGSLLVNPLEILPPNFELSEQPVIKGLLEKGENQLIPDIHSYFGWKGCPAQVCVRSWVIMPLKIEGEVQGICSLGKIEPGYYTCEHIHLIESLVSQAAVALKNGWLFDQVSAGHDRLQHLSRQLVNLQENERSFIARELHDKTSQTLASILVDLDLLSRSTHDPQAIAEGVFQLEGLVGQVMEDLHEIAVNLRPASLDHLGLVDSLRRFVEEFGEKYHISANFATLGLPFHLSGEVEVALYRINQETLTNVARHAHAFHVDVVLEFHPEEVALLIEDDGIGFEPHIKVDKDHLGLLGIRERVETFGGNLLIESAPGEGTVLKVTIPCESRSGRQL